MAARFSRLLKRHSNSVSVRTMYFLRTALYVAALTVLMLARSWRPGVWLGGEAAVFVGVRP